MRRVALLAAGFAALLVSFVSACERRTSTVGDVARLGSSAHFAASSAGLDAGAVIDASAPAVPSAPVGPPRIYVKNRFVFVRPRPDSHADWIGFLWFGASVALRSEQSVGGPGCATYYAVEPNGFVCVDGKQATLDAGDSEFVAVSRYAPRLDQASPHHYAVSAA